jgi:hypothetical protein
MNPLYAAGIKRIFGRIWRFLLLPAAKLSMAQVASGKDGSDGGNSIVVEVHSILPTGTTQEGKEPGQKFRARRGASMGYTGNGEKVCQWPAA